MDAYIFDLTRRLFGRISVRNLIIETGEHMAWFLRTCNLSPSFRAYYFDAEKIQFSNVDKLLILALIGAAPRLFEKITKSPWCEKYAGMICDVSPCTKIIDVEFYYTDNISLFYDDIRVPANINIIKKLLDKGFEEIPDEENTYFYRIRCVDVLAENSCT